MWQASGASRASDVPELSGVPGHPTTGRAHLLRVLDEVDYGMLIIDAQGTILHANHLARHELASGRMLVSYGNTLLGSSAEFTAQMQLAMEAAFRGQRRLALLNQGEREMAAYNKQLGTFELTGLPPAPRGIPQIEVTFDIDANGIVHVAAKDTATGKEQSMTISGGSALSKDDIDRMMREAEQHADEDKRLREEIEVKNTAEALVYQTEKFLKDNEEQIPADAKANVDGPLDELKKAIEANDLEGMKSATDKVAQASQTLGAAMYATAQQSAGGEGAAEAEADMAEDDVVDAEIVDDETTDEQK